MTRADGAHKFIEDLLWKTQLEERQKEVAKGVTSTQLFNGNFLPLIDALDGCHNESVNTKVLQLFVNLLTGNSSYINLKHTLQEKLGQVQPMQEIDNI